MLRRKRVEMNINMQTALRQTRKGSGARFEEKNRGFWFFFGKGLGLMSGISWRGREGDGMRMGMERWDGNEVLFRPGARNSEGYWICEL